MLIAAQVEALGVNGVALAQGRDAMGIRGVPLLSPVGRFDNQLVIATLREMGPYDPQGRYGHVAFRVPVATKAVQAFLRQEMFGTNTPFVQDWSDTEAATIHFQWAFDGQRLVAKYETNLPLDFMVIFNGCIQQAGVDVVDASHAVLQQGELELALTFDRQADQFTAANSDEHAEAQLRGLKWAACTVGRMTAHRFHLTPDAPLYLSIERKTSEVSARQVQQALEQARQQTQTHQMESHGAHADCADAIQRMVGYCRGYDTNRRLNMVSVNRDWAAPNSAMCVFLWDNVFTSAMAGLFSPELAKDSMSFVLDFLDKGVETAPPQRNLIVPVVYSKLVRFMGDRDFAEKSFGPMMKLIRFFFADRGDGHPWRDGNDDGLIECGSCQKPGHSPLGTIIQNAFDETGYDDSPMYSAGFSFGRRGLPAPGVEFDFDRGTLNLTMVGQNSLYVASCRAMAVVAQWLGRKADTEWLTAEADRVAALVGDRLYCPDKGIFLNRFFNGDFSPVKTPDIFSPLLAGVADEGVAGRLKSMLLDEGQFWGENIVPTVSRDDPAFGDEPWHGEHWKGNYWRGNIWAPTNYIVYLSIRQAGWDDVLPEFAAKCRRLFMDDWRAHHFVMENYPPAGRTTQTQMFCGNGGRDTHYIWGGLLAMISLEELFAVEAVSEGIRFGTTDRKSFGSWRGFGYHQKSCSVASGDDGIHLVVPGELEFRSNVPMSVRQFVTNGKSARFQYTCSAPAHVMISLNGQRMELDLIPGEGLIGEVCVGASV